ncbi:MAG: inositol monophosphatase [Myxococcales bacterium]|nr:inositol monophosphatase [Myxococcales bacterium]
MAPPSYSELAELSAIATQVASEAADLVFSAWRTRPEISKKQPKDLVTEWDVKSEQLILKRLGELAPYAILAEESGLTGEADSAAPRWVCDPIDGTTNFAHGHPIWCVSIGLMYRDEPLCGAVVSPTIRTTWSGYKGGGSKRNGDPVEVSRTAVLAEALLATGFPPERERAPYNNFESFERIKKRALAVRRCGSAAMDLCFVADGTYDGYWERRVHVWDLAAAAAIQLAAGGRLTSLAGGPARLEKGHVLGTNGMVHDELLALLADLLEENPANM